MNIWVDIIIAVGILAMPLFAMGTLFAIIELAVLLDPEGDD